VLLRLGVFSFYTRLFLNNLYHSFLFALSDYY